MEKLVITGGNRLEGEVRISGAKNAALPLMAATLLTPGEHILRNVPQLRDIKTFRQVLAALGVKVEEPVPGELHLDSSELSNETAPYELVKTMRASVLVLGPLTARMGEARVSLPGGCAIGARPVDQHLAGLEALGAEVRLEHGYIHTRSRKLCGGDIYFDLSTVTGTENVLMAAVRAEGVTRIFNAAKEPEVVELGRALNSMGARITGLGTEELTVEGVARLRPLDYQVMPDRIEAGTFMIAAVLTGGRVLLKNAEIRHLEALEKKLRAVGAEVEKHPEGFRISRPGALLSADIKTLPYPGFPTDLQAQIMALLCVAKGASVIAETVFENRFMHVNELLRMGANITVSGNRALVKGVERLSAAEVMATDLRASAGLVLAGLVAQGETHVHRIYHLDRGYEKIEEKLRGLGAVISRQPDKKPG